MEISFSTKALREICEKEKSADSELGIESARKLRARLSEIAIADNLEDIPHLPEEINEPSGRFFYFELSEDLALIFEPRSSHAKPAKGSDLKKITRIKISSISPLHEKRGI